MSIRDKANARISGEVISISREEFENVSSNLILQAELAVETALSRIDLEASSITDIILVGGSTRMPIVSESIKKIFGKEPRIFGNPDESVALGAAIYAAYKSDSSKLNPLQKQAMAKVSMSEVAPAYFGTLVMTSNELGSSELQNTVIIPKDEKVPCSVTESYYTIADNQTAVQCRVTQAQSEESDPQFVKMVWDGNLNVPGGRPAGQEIKVTFSYTEDGKMKASFLDVQSGNLTDIDLTINTDGSNDEEIDIDEFKVE